MKTKALKSLMLVAAAIVLVVASVLGTMAYLTSTAAVSNTFSVGNVKLHMYESKVTEDGLRIDADNIATDADGRHYRLNEQTGKYVLDTNIQDSQVNKLKKETSSNNYLLVPGEKYVKDPTITVDAGSVPSYLFVRVRNDIKTIEKNNVVVEQTPAEGEGTGNTGSNTPQKDPTTPSIVEQLRKNGWLEIYRADTNVDAVFVYVGGTVAEGTTLDNLGRAVPFVGTTGAQEAYDVFESFTLSTTCGDNLNSFAGARVAVVAYAIQGTGYTSNHPDGSKDAVMEAWTYIKNELPFVV